MYPAGMARFTVMVIFAWPATCVKVVAGRLTSSKRILFVALVVVEPLFKNTRKTEAVFVPTGKQSIVSTKAPFDPAVAEI